MKHKTWFRLVIKAVGVLLIGLHLRSVTSLLVGFVYQSIENGSLTLYSPDGSRIAGKNAIESLISTVFYSSPEFIGFAFGVYLFFGGNWIVNKCIPSNRPYCPECRYDLSHTPKNDRCAECGVALPSVGDANAG